MYISRLRVFAVAKGGGGCSAVADGRIMAGRLSGLFGVGDARE